MVETILNNQTSEVCPFVSMACVSGQGYNYDYIYCNNCHFSRAAVGGSGDCVGLT